MIVVGAGVGGLRTVEQLRTLGFDGTISLVGEEQHAPYDRPPLSKQVLTGEWEPSRTVLRTRDALDELGVRAHLGVPAVRVRPGEVELSDGRSLRGDAVVAATGLAPRALPGQPEPVFRLRTVGDAVALRDTLARIGSLLIIGGGFIGAEVASAARRRGIAVTVIEALPVPSARVLGHRLGALAGRLLTEGGVTLRTGCPISGFESAGRDGRVAVRLADGEIVQADAAVVGIGGVPRIEWLDATGVDTTDGIACGPTGRVHGLAGTWAVGDIAAWDDPEHGGRYRHEHWTSAVDQAAAAARDILGLPAADASVPYFWSDQFGVKIQLVGRPDTADGILPLRGEGLDGGPVRGTVVGYTAGDRLVAVIGFGAAGAVARYRRLVTDGADSAKALALSA
ncbi:NAD(P)/FAD-dependent oxidoreductase [Actinomadura sp. LOL_016]|uniref:NAD(P)/FAD-dependent oxidoreductase n=1 Tax=unclassified Actinomadura TaxID=2626254 RepID=UPI003A802801